jgi:putative ABC transport system ATP-binding protein
MENVAMGLRLAGHSWPAASRDAARLLAHLGLGDRLHARPSALSFGEQQRVAIARALGSRPRLLLADEPTASLDWEAGRLALDTMVSLARAQRTAVIIATHDPRVLPYATRALHLSDGVLVEDRIVNGPPPDGQQASRRAPALSEPAPWAAAR